LNIQNTYILKMVKVKCPRSGPKRFLAFLFVLLSMIRSTKIIHLSTEIFER